MKYMEFLTYLRDTFKNPPINTFLIIEHLNILLRGSDHFNDAISGKIYKIDPHTNENKHYKIVVNLNHSRERQRFTIAHEIAHYILHRDQIGNGIVDDALYSSILSNEIEKEANEFATEILMPMRLLTNSIREHGIDPKKLAEEYFVSETAMAIRLGYIT